MNAIILFSILAINLSGVSNFSQPDEITVPY